MTLLPIFLKLEGLPCVVVGGGRTAEAKIRSLLRAKAEVAVVAPKATQRVRDWAREGKIRLMRRNFRSGDLDGISLVISATNSCRVNQAVLNAARQRRIFCNAVDDPERCDFFCGAVVRRGDLQIAISTAGASPSLAQRLRRDLERQFKKGYAAWIEHLRGSRADLLARRMSVARRRRALHRLASHAAYAKFSAERRALRRSRGLR